jgi:hypothetical protein
LFFLAALSAITIDHSTLNTLVAKTSVIIPTHNRPELLPRAVRSASSAGRDVEVIVVDDASTDRTAEVCSSLSGIKYVRLERNQRVAGARNVGLMHSEGEFVTFLDDDDLRLPGSIDSQARTLMDNPEAGFVCGAMIIADQNYQPNGEVTHPGHSSGDVFWPILALDFPAMGLSTLIRKECFTRVGPFRKHLAGIDDWDLLVRISELYPGMVISEPVGIYRQPTPDSDQGSSASAGQLKRVAQHQRHLFRRLPRASAASASQRRDARRRMTIRIADTLLWQATRHIPRKEFSAAVSAIFVALQLRPLRALRPAAYKKLATTVIKLS